MDLERLVGEAQTIAVICNQWGDTGKGKFVELISSQWADVTARGTGGNNAGHTTVVNGRERIFHIVPSGITNGKVNILGNGMVLDLEVLSSELDSLEGDGIDYSNLMISLDAHVIMPYHIERDGKNLSQEDGGIGTTGRGIGPCYEDKVARRGIMIRDLFKVDTLARKIDKIKDIYPELDIDRDEIIEHFRFYTERIKPFLRDTVAEMHGFMRDDKKILLEGAQGLLLSIEHGTYPYVTSSDSSLNGTANGVGLSAKAIDLPLGIVKFPFMTRVGAGPFPTELGGNDSEAYCADDRHTKSFELSHYGIPHEVNDGNIEYDRQDPNIIDMVNYRDPFMQGIGIRLAAGEYGATTGRPRRVGWTDALAARYAVGINGPLMILTKADTLSGSDEFKVSYGYEESHTSFPRDEDALRSATPKYRTYQGYGDIGSVRTYDGLPSSLRSAIEDFETFSRGKVVVVSVGADREETIIK